MDEGQDAVATQGRAGDDPLVRLCAVLFGLTSLWFLVQLVHAVGPPVLLWLATPVTGVAASVIFWRAARVPGAPAPTSRFWRHLTPVPAIVALGGVAQAVAALSAEHVVAYPAPGLLVIDGVALVCVIFALLRLPTGRRDRGGAVRVMLDASTVVLATGVFLWEFDTRQAVRTAASGAMELGAVMLSVLLVVLALLGVLALAKVMLSEYSVIDPGSLRLLGLAMFIGALAPSAHPLVAAVNPQLYVVQVTVPAVFLCAALAGARQYRLEAGVRHSIRHTRPKAFSLLPYTAVAAVDALLLWVVCTGLEGVGVVATAAVALTAVVVLRQITALRDNGRLLTRLDHGATHDALTGLPNRVLFQRRLHQALTAPGDRRLSVVLIDLDDFKEVNDTLGHEVGDLLLVAVAERLSGCLREGDTVARLGGDEFVMVLRDVDPAGADGAADRMLEALRPPVPAAGHDLVVKASIGIADGRTGNEASILLRQADIAMYAAKKIEGSAYLHHHAEMTSGSDHANLAAELREAIASDQLFLLYQPIVGLDDGRLIGAEALVRWAHPARGVLSPDVFIPVAERSGLTVELARWVMRTAFRQLAEWPAGPPGTVPTLLSVNLSARDLREPGLAGEIADLLRASGVAPQRITIEITEAAALDSGEAVATVHELRELGVRVSLDDFGTGYSTLALLHACPVDEIKLDRSFTGVRGPGQVPMAAAVIHLAQVLGLHAVAEGVENEEQAEELLALGYIAAQGYHFARPLPPERFGELLAAPQQAASLLAG